MSDGRLGPPHEDGTDLFRVGNLLSLEHTTARLIGRSVSQFTVVVDLLPKFASKVLPLHSDKRELGALDSADGRASHPLTIYNSYCR